jgi:hypothetical protein
MRTSPRAERIYPYIRPQLRERLAKVCAATRTTESAVVSEALQKHLDGTSDLALTLRRLDRLTRSLDRVLWSLEVVSQAFATFVRVWFAHTPRIAREARSHARAQADARYRQFMERLSEQLSGGKRFVDDLPQERIADDEELDDIRRGVSGESAGDDASSDSAAMQEEPMRDDEQHPDETRRVVPPSRFPR